MRSQPIDHGAALDGLAPCAPPPGGHRLAARRGCSGSGSPDLGYSISVVSTNNVRFSCWSRLWLVWVHVVGNDMSSHVLGGQQPCRTCMGVHCSSHQRSPRLRSTSPGHWEPSAGMVLRCIQAFTCLAFLCCLEASASLRADVFLCLSMRALPCLGPSSLALSIGEATSPRFCMTCVEALHRLL